ncbi:hypothetical protein PIB30_062213 [Stylosanthes scabra]|uniref:DUF4220 domain-containing protein n=1 Tax=Stylosanthes scabra TaxID=79078 RepID=A0ABU6ZJS9_9FABA|nr:hypothetical protein [Stylosanthes scabra]
MAISILLHITDVWHTWKLRAAVLMSLAVQVTLTIFGSRRKQTRCRFMRGLVWIAYTNADYLAATASLGAISRKHGSSVSLQSLWVPFLLLHLGGPDTITAYSLEDNNLWPRHLLNFVARLIIVFLFYLTSWSSNPLYFIAVIPVLISGMKRYWERNWVLRSAAPDEFEDSLKKGPAVVNPDLDHIHHLPCDSEPKFIHMGYSLFPLLQRLYSNLSLPFSEGQRSRSLILKMQHGDKQEQTNNAFKVVEVQLGFLYDMLYTKAPAMYSALGIVFRLFSVFSIGSAFVVFILVVDTSESPRVDIWITYALFIWVISLELYVFVFVLIPSDWSVKWLTKSQHSCHITNLIKILRLGEKRWSGDLGQHNLLSLCMKKSVARFIRLSDKRPLTFLMKGDVGLLYKIYFSLESYFWRRQIIWKDVDNELKKLIFEFLEKRYEKWAQRGFGYQERMNLLSHKGAKELKGHKLHKLCGWSVENIEFNHSVLIWHIATDICYYSTSTPDEDSKRASKTISDYMMYILLTHPSLLPKWIDRFTHVRDTLRETVRMLHPSQLPPVAGSAIACSMLKEMYRRSHQPLKQQITKEKSGQSVLLDGYRLASQLQSRKSPWTVICDVWMEMLTFAASQCDWSSHAKQLTKGGELLTHVCVLMADLCLSKQFDLGEQPPLESQNALEEEEAAQESHEETWGCVQASLTLLAVAIAGGAITHLALAGLTIAARTFVDCVIVAAFFLVAIQN